MRISLILLALTVGPVTALFGQVSVPSEVASTFKEQHPEIAESEVEWQWCDTKKLYEAQFLDETTPKEAFYDSEGNWIKTTKRLHNKDVPQKVWTSLGESSYKRWDVESVGAHNTPYDPKLYEVRVTKGKREAKLCFSSQGEVVRKVICH